MKIDDNIEIDKLFSLVEEENRLNLVKSIVDFSCAVIVAGIIDERDIDSLQDWTRSKVMTFIPGEDEKYAMIYASRLKRLAEQFSSDNNKNTEFI